MMEALNCNNCGAQLDVPVRANFAMCAYCGSRLVIKRSATAAYTEVLERLDQRTASMSADLEAIRLQNQLEQLDREWQMEREQYLIRSKGGSTHVPESTVADTGCMVIFAVIGIAVAGVSSFVTVAMMTGGAELGSCLPLIGVGFGLLFAALAVRGGTQANENARQYGNAVRSYQRRRHRLVRRLGWRG